MCFEALEEASGCPLLKLGGTNSGHTWALARLNGIFTWLLSLFNAGAELPHTLFCPEIHTGASSVVYSLSTHRIGPAARE